MNSSVFKYKDSKNKSTFLKVIAGEKWPWINRGIEDTLRILFFPLRYIKPFSELIGKTPGGVNGKLFRLVRAKKYEEGYEFGVQWLTELLSKMSKPESMIFEAEAWSWWFAFNSVCQCALEIDREGSYSVLSELVEKGPGPKDGYPAVECYYNLSRLALGRSDSDAAWAWIERAVQSDDSYAWAFHMRAWLGVLLGKGQPLEDLKACLTTEPDLKQVIYEEDLFIKAPNLLEDLKKWEGKAAVQGLKPRG